VLAGEPPDHRRGTFELERLGALDLPAPVAVAPRLFTPRFVGRSLHRTITCSDRLSFAVSGRELLSRGLCRLVFSRRGFGRLRFPCDGDKRDLGAHVDRSTFRDKELLDLAGHRRG
jgi:hypothetical protein